MAIVLVADQRASSKSHDLVDVVWGVLNERHAEQLALPFVRTAGDEMQALLGDPAALAPLAADLLEARDWWIGVGLGAVSRHGASSRESAGPASEGSTTSATVEPSASGRLCGRSV